MKLLLSIFCLFVTLGVLGQTGVTGKITTADGKPLSYVNVLLLNSRDSSLVKGGVSGTSGAFTLENIPAGAYFLQYSAVGFQTVNTAAFNLGDSSGKRDLRTQVMEADPKSLQAVVVHAQKPLYQHEIDRMVINVQSSVLSKGSSALDILQRSPGVIVDRQSSDLALNGKKGVMVMINGRLMRMSLSQVFAMLDGMSADNIEKIELISTPPAKYDAEGSAGLINIVLKKNPSRGTKGSASVTGGYGWGDKERASVRLTHNTGMVALYGYYTWSHNKSFNQSNSYGYEDAPPLGGPLTFTSEGTSKPGNTSHDATLGFDVTTKKTNYGASVNYNVSKATTDNMNMTAYNIQPDSFLRMNSSSSGTNRWKNVISSVYLERQLREGEKINFDVDYLYYKNNAVSIVRNNFTDRHEANVTVNDTLFSPYKNSFASAPISTVVGKVDYSKKWSPTVTMESGIKGSYTHVSSASGIQSQVNDSLVTSPGTSLGIVMNEHIGAAYTSFNIKLSKTINMIAGARYEYSDTRMTDPSDGKVVAERKLGKIFPSLFLSKSLNENSVLELSYTERIRRPSYNDLAPYIAYNDPVSVITGNTLLKPTITNNLKFGYAYKQYSFSLLFSWDQNPIAGYQVVTSPDGRILYISPQNVAWQNYITFQTDIPVKVTDWWSMNLGYLGGLREFKIDYTAVPVKKTYFGYSFYGTQTFKLPAKFSLELNGYYNSLSYEGSVRTAGYSSVTVGIQKELRGNAGVIQFTIDDLFRSQQYITDYGKLTKEAFSLDSHLSYYPESHRSQIFKLTYFKAFGKTSVGGRKKRELGSTEESGRVKKD